MIVIEKNNTNPYAVNGNAIKKLGKSLPEIVSQPISEVCVCDFVGCDYVETVFASPTNPNDYWKNDKSDFLFRRLITTDVVNMELHKDEVKVTDLNNNDLGVYFDGFSGTEEQQRYKGYLLDWLSVYNAHGVGTYKVVANTTIVGVPNTIESREFNLQLYSDLAADNTVVVESVQDGNIFGNSFDFTGLEWRQQIRIKGYFGNPTPTYETTEYITSTHERKQNKAIMSREWELKTELLNWEVASKLIYNKLLANEILITDYSIKAESLWRRISVMPKDVEKPQIANTPNQRYNIKFSDKLDKFTKRNF